jgi:hypothetical protein
MKVKHLIVDDIPERRPSPVSPHVLCLAIAAAYPFNTGSGTAARKRPTNGHHGLRWGRGAIRG